MKKALKNQTGFIPSKTILVLLHLAFWILLFGITFVIFSGFLKPGIAFTRSFFLTIFLVVVYYINTLLLINVLFEGKKYWLYGISIVLFSLLAIKLKFQMDFVWLEKESGFLKAAGTRASHVVASLPIIFDLIFSTLLQLLLNRYNRMQTYRARLTELTSAQFIKGTD